MADVKICDRCGKKIEAKVIPLYMQHFRSYLDMEVQDYTYEYDLCGTCTKRLFEFMNGSVTGSVTEATDAVVKE